MQQQLQLQSTEKRISSISSLAHSRTQWEYLTTYEHKALMMGNGKALRACLCECLWFNVDFICHPFTPLLIQMLSIPLSYIDPRKLHLCILFRLYRKSVWNSILIYPTPKAFLFVTLPSQHHHHIKARLQRICLWNHLTLSNKCPSMQRT